MPGGRLWGALFFVFLFFAALSTVTAVFENILACWMDRWNISRGKAVAANLVLILLLSLPCLLGNNLWSGVHILGMSIMDFEDFLVSNNLLPPPSTAGASTVSWRRWTRARASASPPGSGSTLHISCR